MKKSLVRMLLVLMVLGVVSCARDFLSPQFSSKTKGHKRVAILPYQMVYTGRQDKNLSPTEKDKIAEAEAQAFQRALHNQLLRFSGPEKDDIKIEFQTPERTNRILQDSGISLTQAWQKTPEELSKILGVESIVYTRVEKEKFLTELESFGLEIAGDILDKIKLPDVLNLPPGADPDFYNRTYRIKIDCQLLNGADASLLWKLPLDMEIDWNSRANDVIEQSARTCAKKFPYRQRSYYH
ncbi:MAG: hypothetical protein LPK45_05295 [Bacteroidota bacterium]|nr:hypothetical protein [Bacteroidota bacterium]MDX5430474.1 hypothetical protein [Bacteroidota bacterium]MDX5469235.1 hypothetical protein [Bacteroidota bacterium]